MYLVLMVPALIFEIAFKTTLALTLELHVKGRSVLFHQ